MRGLVFFVVLMVALILPIASSASEEGKIKILAITDEGGKVRGSVADLSLEIVPGKGRVFLETFPVTKIDTQISMRFAQQFACDWLSMDCSDKDFIYIIRAGSSIIGGPSAGASATALTISVLGDIDLRNDVVMTGTINPGGLIGGVGGLKDKITAAKQANFSTVIIPYGKKMYEENNESLDLVKWGQSLGITVIEASLVEEVMSLASYETFDRPMGELGVDEQYLRVMNDIANRLCERNDRLRAEFARRRNGRNLSAKEMDVIIDSEEMLVKAKRLMSRQNFYPAASFCFRSNVNMGYMNVRMENLSQENLSNELIQVKKGVKSLNDNVSKQKVRSISDLQTYLIVKERMIEANDNIDESLSGKSDLQYSLALSNERLYSAIAWSSFFMSESKSYDIDGDSLNAACEEKIREAEERYQYVSIYIPQGLEQVRRDIDRAYVDAQRGNPDQCLFKASKAKADADVVISVLGAKSELLREIVSQKIDLAKQAIIKSQHKGLFPIIGYSYYEYAQVLMEDDLVSALRFAQYASELSGLDIYVKPPRKFKILVDYKSLAVLFSGIVIGFAVSLMRKRDS